MYSCRYCAKGFKKKYCCHAHERLCRLNPDFEKVRLRCVLGGKNASHSTAPRVERIRCVLKCMQCGKSFSAEFTPYELSRKKGKFYCSRSCANTRTHSDETRAKISKSLMAFPREKKPPKQQYHCKLCHSVISCPRPSGFCQNCLRKTPEGRKYLSEHVKGSGAGGYHGNAYGGIKGSYLGIHCDSTWELVYLIYQLDHGVQVSRNKDVFLYVYNGEVRKYYPDFKEGDTYIEIKGREWPNWKYKLEQFPKNKKLKVLYRKDIAPYLDYVKSKYGSNLAMLYDQPKAIDYTKYHWYTNTITKEIKFSNVKLEYPYVLGRV